MFTLWTNLQYRYCKKYLFPLFDSLGFLMKELMIFKLKSSSLKMVSFYKSELAHPMKISELISTNFYINLSQNQEERLWIK